MQFVLRSKPSEVVIVDAVRFVDRATPSALSIEVIKDGVNLWMKATDVDVGLLIEAVACHPFEACDNPLKDCILAILCVSLHRSSGFQ